MLMTIICAYCGKQKEKKVFPSKIPHFCNLSCCVSYNNKHRDVKKPEKKEIMVCPNCKQEFKDYKKYNRKFCSISCAHSGKFNHNYKEKNKYVCKVCKKEFEDYGFKNRVVCSMDCLAKYKIGKKYSNESKEKMRENHYDCKGINNPRYGINLDKELRDKISRIKKEKYLEKCKKENKEPYIRKMRPKMFDRWAKQIKKRDNYTCQICHEKGGKLNSHHIKSWKDYPDNRFDLDNGITLCVACHNWTHSIKGDEM